MNGCGIGLRRRKVYKKIEQPMVMILKVETYRYNVCNGIW